MYSLLIPQALLLLLLVWVLADVLLLLSFKFICNRQIAQRLSNGDFNTVQLQFWHSYPFPIKVSILEEFPEQFQVRNQAHAITLSSRRRTSFNYLLRPVLRGDYHFGHTICLLKTPLSIAKLPFFVFFIMPQFVIVTFLPIVPIVELILSEYDFMIFLRS